MKCLVTGGGGFVGKAVALRLRLAGHEVCSLSRGSYPELEQHGIRSFQGDISGDRSTLREAFEGIELVFHVAAKVEMWGPKDDFYRVNVVGTENVIEACREHGIRALVYTSSPSVVADGSNLRGVDESRPYPDRYKAYYPQTKAIAERAVLAANSDRLKTCALRPHLIWGPGDTNLVPTILSKAKTGRLVQVGEGQNLVDLSFIEDCVEAHLAAGESLLAHDARAAGKAYFISQGEPVKMWHWINEVLKRNGVHPITKRVSFRFADTAALFLETMSRLSPIPFEPPLTRFLVSEMATDHYFSIRAAQRDFGYQPRFSIEEALDITFPRVLADSSQRRLFAVGL